MADHETAARAPQDDRLDQVIGALRLMIETQNTHSQMLARLIELATPSEAESPLEAAMTDIAEALREQTATLERIGTTLDGLGEEVEAGVLRGLASALEPDNEGPAQPAGAGEGAA